MAMPLGYVARGKCVTRFRGRGLSVDRPPGDGTLGPSEHERDVNAALNIRYVGLRCRASVRGNELVHDMLPVEQDTPVLARYGWGACYATA